MTITPEIRWIASVLARYWNPMAVPEAPAAPDAEFWHEVRAQAIRHRVAGQLYREIAANPELAPADVGHWLGFAHSLPLMRLGHWPAAVKEVLEALNRAGIEFLVLKGWWLLEEFFQQDLGLRPPNDLDLLLRRTDLERAEEVLRRIGMAPAAVDLWPGFKQRYLHEQGYARTFEDKLRFVVELHWEIGFDLPGFNFVRHDEWYGRALDATVRGVEVKVPCREDLFVYLCGHLRLQHPDDQAQLLRFHDLALLAAVPPPGTPATGSPALDFARVIERARAWQLTACLQKTMYLLREIWPDVVPREIHEEVLRLEPGAAEQEFLARALRAGASPTYLRFRHFRALPGFFRKIRFALEWLFPSPRYMRERYCPKQSCWYLPIAYPRRLLGGLAVLLRH